MKTTMWRVGGAVALMLAFTACGGGGDDGGAGSAQSPQGTQSVSSQDTGSMSPQLQYAQCMRDNGVDMPDPVEGVPGSLFEGVDKTSPAYVTADETCRHFLAGVIQDRKDQQPKDEQHDAEMLELAKCLRDKGVEVKDPVPGQGFGKDLDRTDPNVSKVLAECQKK